MVAAPRTATQARTRGVDLASPISRRPEPLQAVEGRTPTPGVVSETFSSACFQARLQPFLAGVSRKRGVSPAIQEFTIAE